MRFYVIYSHFCLNFEKSLKSNKIRPKEATTVKIKHKSHFGGKFEGVFSHFNWNTLKPIRHYLHTNFNLINVHF